MAQNTYAHYLVTYDIANPRRLGRLFRYLKKEGIPVQYSVFLVETSAVKIGHIMGRIAKIINLDEDDVRAYRLPDNGWQVSLGASILPDDVLPGTAGMTHARSQIA
ncbi:MAG: CRISPR-associated endonuclease Cas2 [Comamonadaceae bacterium CG_4_9_14_0_8_um_filter_57_21]|nr:MAG: CRISPR-associated endonuclease Cas2 [Comamonadaceae bacterium CG_4_9_14_0_8_um_filter_57_21]